MKTSHVWWRVAGFMVAGVVLAGSVAGSAQTWRHRPAGSSSSRCSGCFSADSNRAPGQGRVSAAGIACGVRDYQHKVRVSTVARGIDRPWSLLILPDGDMLVSQRYERDSSHPQGSAGS